MNQLHHGGLMRCCVEKWEAMIRNVPTDRLTPRVQTGCCNQYIERRPDGDWEWVGAERQREMEEQE